MKKGKILIKYENIYLFLIIPFMIYQLIKHSKTVLFTDLVLEFIILLLVYYLGYISIKGFRIETQKKL